MTARDIGCEGAARGPEPVYGVDEPVEEVRSASNLGSDR
jgi:hypothetical protein